MFEAIARMARAVDVPVTADIEAGYGLSPDELDRLLEAGAVGCNLEAPITPGAIWSTGQAQARPIAAVKAAGHRRR